jgi:hypothetical protein
MIINILPIDIMHTENIVYKSLEKSMKYRQKEYRRFVIVNDIKQRLDLEQFIGTPEFTKKMEGYFSIKDTNLKKRASQKD